MLVRNPTRTTFISSRYERCVQVSQPDPERKPQGRWLDGVSRVMVSLMWGILLVVVIAVLVLAMRFYG